MKHNIVIRPSKKIEAAILTELTLQAGGGIAEYLLTGLMPGFTPYQIVLRQMAMEELPYCYRTIDVAELEDQIIGITQYYSAEYLRIPSPDEPSFIPRDRQAYLLTPMYRNCPKNSVYLSALATVPKFQGLGIGTSLLDHVKKIAMEKHQSITLHAWCDNKNAIALYEREGFSIAEHINILRQPLLPHDGGMVLMIWS